MSYIPTSFTQSCHQSTIHRFLPCLYPTEFRCCSGMTPLLHFKHLQGLILKPPYAGTVSLRGWISQKRRASGEICRNVVCWAEAPTPTEDCPQPPWMCCEFSPRTGSAPTLTMNKNPAEHIPVCSSHWNLTVQVLCTPAPPLSLVRCSPLQATTANVGV